ncbi:MAG: hypothetical protein KAJ40_05980 [Alphaproteobacteria bacterium]|nr:hypothetical protein [Alphaproteobacteria bacterium]
MFNSKLKKSILLKICMIAVALIVFSSTNSSAQEKPPWQIKNEKHKKECAEGREKVKARAIEKATVLDESLRDEFVSKVLEKYNGSCRATKKGESFYEPLLIGYEAVEGCLRGIEKNYEKSLQFTKRMNESVKEDRANGTIFKDEHGKWKNKNENKYQKGLKTEITPLSEVKRRISSCDMDLSRCVDAEKLRARLTGDTRLRHLFSIGPRSMGTYVQKEKFDEYDACRVDYIIKKVSSSKAFPFGAGYNIGAEECGEFR